MPRPHHIRLASCAVLECKYIALLAIGLMSLGHLVRLHVLVWPIECHLVEYFQFEAINCDELECGREGRS